MIEATGRGDRPESLAPETHALFGTLAALDGVMTAWLTRPR
jgi:hypothetical protein